MGVAAGEHPFWSDPLGMVAYVGHGRSTRGPETESPVVAADRRRGEPHSRHISVSHGSELDVVGGEEGLRG